MAVLDESLGPQVLPKSHGVALTHTGKLTRRYAGAKAQSERQEDTLPPTHTQRDNVRKGGHTDVRGM